MKKFLMLILFALGLMAGCNKSDPAHNNLYQTSWEGVIISSDKEETAISMYFYNENELGIFTNEDNDIINYVVEGEIVHISFYSSPLFLPSNWYIEKLTKNTLQLSEWGNELGYKILLTSKL